ncbi:MAG: hypothetical protein R3F50_19785 [Gammaproteobacteria bacterium]|jgi:hypothetical protein
MSDKDRLPQRPTTGMLAMLFILLFVIMDLILAEPIDPYQAPYPTALGSGQVPSGAHCTNVSGIE